MKFDAVDPIFGEWARRHSLQVYKEYKDEEVRCVRMYGQGKEYAGISIDPKEDGRIVVGVGISRRPSRNSQYNELVATLDNLESVLERAYSTAVGWLGGDS